MKLQNEGTETLCWPLIPPDSHTHSTHHLSLSSETLKTSRVRGRPSVSLPSNRHTARWSRAGRHRCWTVNHYDDERWKINILIWSHRSNTFHMFNYVLVDVTKRLTDRRMRGFHSRRCENEALSVGAVPPSSLRPELSDLFSHRGHVTDFRLVRWDCRGQQEPGGPDPTTLPPECRCPAVHFLHRALLACLWNRVLQEGARNLTVTLGHKLKRFHLRSSVKMNRTWTDQNLHQNTHLWRTQVKHNECRRPSSHFFLSQSIWLLITIFNAHERDSWQAGEQKRICSRLIAAGLPSDRVGPLQAAVRWLVSGPAAPLGRFGVQFHARVPPVRYQPQFCVYCSLSAELELRSAAADAKWILPAVAASH